MIPGKPSLEIYGIGRLNRAVGTEFNRGTLYKGSRSHDDRTVIAGHIPGFGGDKAVYRSSCLDSLTEGDHSLRSTEGNGLDDIMT